ncbi:YueI family protein [Halanaerobium saccharolyticum]|uniref:YueI family protein n=1 Tax=Halanaerobium saccharolyticum TaxID=43595 RepID=UPI003FCDDFA3
MNNNGESKLEKTAREGAFGPTELKKGEKNRFLGEFEERVIAYLSESQIKEKALYPEIKEALQSKEANKLIIRGDIDKSLISDYIEWAREAGVSFNRKNSPEFRGNVALAVAGKDAVKQQFGKIPDREEKLQKKGLSDNIIKNAGSLLCSDCWKELMEKAPEEKVNYKKAGIFDKLTGTGCTGCQKK